MNKELLQTHIEDFNRWNNYAYQKGDILLEAIYDDIDKDIKVHLYRYLGNSTVKQIYIEPFGYCDFINLTALGIANRTLEHTVQMLVAGEE